LRWYHTGGPEEGREHTDRGQASEPPHSILPPQVQRKAAAAADFQEMLVSGRVTQVQRTEVTGPVPQQCGTRIGVIAVDHCACPANSFQTTEAAADTS